MQQLSLDFEPAGKMTFSLSVDSIDTLIFPMGKYPPSDESSTVGEMEYVDDYGEDKSWNNFGEQNDSDHDYLNIYRLKTEVHGVSSKTEADNLDNSRCRFTVIEGDFLKEKTARDDRHDTDSSAVKSRGPLQVFL